MVYCKYEKKAKRAIKQLCSSAFTLMVLLSVAASSAFAAEVKALSNPTEMSRHSSQILLVVGVLSFFVLVLAAFNHWRNSQRTLRPVGCIEDFAQIRRIMHLAVQQRSTFELQFPEDGGKKHPTMRCVPQRMVRRKTEKSDIYIVLEAGDIKDSAPYWTGKPVNCYFKVNIDGQPVYYSFESVVKEMRAGKGQLCMMFLPLPQKIDNRQKRAYLRLVPPREYFLGGALWYGKNLTLEALSGDPSRWPRAQLISTPDGENSFEFIDISSGGVRLSVSRDILIEAKGGFSLGAPLVLRLLLLDPEKNSKMRFWFFCRLSNAAEYSAKNFEIGLEFMAWDLAETDGSMDISWRKLRAEGEVDPLGNWIMRRHLEVFRDNPQSTQRAGHA